MNTYQFTVIENMEKKRTQRYSIQVLGQTKGNYSLNKLLDIIRRTINGK